MGKPETSVAWKPKPTLGAEASADDDPSGTISITATAARSPSHRTGERRNVRTSMCVPPSCDELPLHEWFDRSCLPTAQPHGWPRSPRRSEDPVGARPPFVATENLEGDNGPEARGREPYMERARFGREAELARVSSFLDAVPNGPDALVLGGEAGIGKSARVARRTRRRPGPAPTVCSRHGPPSPRRSSRSQRWEISSTGSSTRSSTRFPHRNEPPSRWRCSGRRPARHHLIAAPCPPRSMGPS